MHFQSFTAVLYAKWSSRYVQLPKARIEADAVNNRNFKRDVLVAASAIAQAAETAGKYRLGEQLSFLLEEQLSASLLDAWNGEKPSHFLKIISF